MPMLPLPDWPPLFDVISVRMLLGCFDQGARHGILRRLAGRHKPAGMRDPVHAESLHNPNLPARMLATAGSTRA